MMKDYDSMLKDYPEHITKEQLYKICHVSKKTALYYLESGLIPCVDSGKKKRRFTILTNDVLTFLEKRDNAPNQYKAPAGWYTRDGNPNLLYKIVRIKKNIKTETRLTRWLEEYPDLMKPIAISKLTGYSLKTVHSWCSANKLHCFRIRRALLIPKLSLIEFMMSDTFIGIKVMKTEYGEFWQNYAKTTTE